MQTNNDNNENNENDDNTVNANDNNDGNNATENNETNENQTEMPENPKAPEVIKNPVNTENTESAKKKQQPVYKTAAILGIITLATALILAILNSLTAPVITKELEEEQQDAVTNLFGGGIYAEKLTGYEEIYSDFDSPVTEVLTVKKDGTDEIIGYCVTVIPHGFGGAMNMLVAVNPDDTVKDTEIVSMSETAGLGTKIDGASFKDQFIGKTKDITVGGIANSIDTIAGATISSKAFLNGVNSALAVLNEILSEMAETTNITPATETAGNTTDTSVSDTINPASASDNSGT
ncbi:MAG: FMN-binding protein [Oscillospiraceae bacterium]|nr:FMN-binding protein [Oscillospiraceae bacterium]